MKVLGIVAGRHNGNSEILVKEALLACQEQGVIPAGASAGFRTPGRDEKPLRQEGRAGMRFHAEKASSPENPP